jgi:uncharacterized protein YecE (DUF72 family)
LVGTSGFSYRDWVGSFYPPGTSHRSFLRIYSQAFPLVEINSTYYQLPSPESSAALLEKADPGFSFVYKTHGSLTHTIGPDWADNAKRFLAGVEPIRAVGALAGILIQLPYSFHYDVPNRRHLAALLDTLTAGLGSPGGATPPAGTELSARTEPAAGSELSAEPEPAAGSEPAAETQPPALFVEFRNREWQKERVFAHLEEVNASIVQTDLPDLPGLPLPRDLVLSGRGYLRLHGRNESMWWNGDNRSRYDYLYRSTEISDLADRVVAMAERSQELIVTFNNHANAQAVKNAYELIDALETRGIEPVKPPAKG